MRLIDFPSRRVWRVLQSQLAPATAAAALVAAAGLYLNWSERTPALPGFAGAAALAAPALVIRVVDGDTIDAVVPPSHQLLRYRLIGFDTPETYYAQCDEERSLGYRAAGRLEQLVQDAGVQMGVQRGSKDRYGRGLAKLNVGGQDVAEIMIREAWQLPTTGGGSGPTGVPSSPQSERPICGRRLRRKR